MMRLRNLTVQCLRNLIFLRMNHKQLIGIGMYMEERTVSIQGLIF